MRLTNNGFEQNPTKLGLNFQNKPIRSGANFENSSLGEKAIYHRFTLSLATAQQAELAFTFKPKAH